MMIAITTVIRIMETTPTMSPALLGVDCLGRTGSLSLNIGLVMGMSHMSPDKEKFP